MRRQRARYRLVLRRRLVNASRTWLLGFEFVASFRSWDRVSVGAMVIRTLVSLVFEESIIVLAFYYANGEAQLEVRHYHPLPVV